ncbi:uncharacterized protein LOC121385876 [Gigantopelta aegis]|uniref:uncharacterized protein LOC121385876 n=1 Tax=Gigantopelta aegis TaxID=1735272 RepID=UPI001B8882D1|nr:uncharacterized protein LOC121385876 [Gigantopelta aegis]
MTHLLILVVMLISAVSVEGNPTCSGCLVEGTCRESGYSETSNTAGGRLTCGCNGKLWECTVVPNPVFYGDPSGCAGCMVANECKPVGYQKHRQLEHGRETCTCTGIVAWSCTAVGIPLFITRKPTIAPTTDVAP